MAKKKTKRAKKKKTTRKKSAGKKKITGGTRAKAKGTPKKKKKATGKKSTRKKKTTASKKKTGSDKKSASKKRSRSKRSLATVLGRPKVTADEKLYILFREDFHARQIFAFLGADTVRDLESYTPEQIFTKLTDPIRETIDRIRERLAEKNRCLAEDIDFLLEWKDQQT